MTRKLITSGSTFEAQIGYSRAVVVDVKMVWRVPMEIILFVAIWTLAFLVVVLKGDLLIHYESYSTGTPVETIVARQNESSGMYAFGEALEEFYLVILLYLLWPIVFNLAGRVFGRRTHP